MIILKTQYELLQDDFATRIRIYVRSDLVVAHESSVCTHSYVDFYAVKLDDVGPN